MASRKIPPHNPLVPGYKVIDHYSGEAISSEDAIVDDYGHITTRANADYVVRTPKLSTPSKYSPKHSFEAYRFLPALTCLVKSIRLKAIAHCSRALGLATKVATMTGSASLSISAFLGPILKSLAASMSGAVGLLRVVSKSLSVALNGASSVVKSVVLKVKSSVSSGVSALTVLTSIIRAATSSGISTLVRQANLAKSQIGTGVSTLVKATSHTLSATAFGVATLSAIILGSDAAHWVYEMFNRKFEQRYPNGGTSFGKNLALNNILKG